MADLWVYQPEHGYSEDQRIFVSWLPNDFYFVGKTDDNAVTRDDSYRLKIASGGTEFVQFDATIIDGYTRKITSGQTDNTIDGLEHLEGETATVYSAGAVFTSGVVSSGSLAIPRELFSYVVGLPFTLSIKTSRLEVPAAKTNQTRIKRINETVIRHIRTQGGIAGQEYNGKSYISNLGAVFSNQSNDSTIATEGGFTEDAYTIIQSNDPDPMTILAAIIGYTVEEIR